MLSSAARSNSGWVAPKSVYKYTYSHFHVRIELIETYLHKLHQELPPLSLSRHCLRVPGGPRSTGRERERPGSTATPTATATGSASGARRLQRAVKVKAKVIVMVVGRANGYGISPYKHTHTHSLMAFALAIFGSLNEHDALPIPPGSLARSYCSAWQQHFMQSAATFDTFWAAIASSIII